MKIGIMVSTQKPLAGGGYTFEAEILSAFYQIQSQSSHKFFLFGHAPVRPPEIAATELPWLSLHRSRGVKRRQKWEGLQRGLRAKVMRKATDVFDYQAFPELERHGLDLLCYLTPMVRPVADIPYITTVWDLEHRVQPFFPEVSLQGEFESRERRYREVLPRAAYVLALGRRGRQQVIDLFHIAEDRVRTMGLPTPGFALRERANSDANPSVTHLGVTGEFLFYPSQFWAHKNHVCLLHALKLLKEKHQYTPQLVLSGADKGNLAHIRDVARELGVNKQVVFAGFVSRQDLVALYRRALALVYPTFFGPENLPTLEAFALGCPVLASAIPGHDDQLGDAAILVPPSQPEQWADAIWRLRQNPELRSHLIEAGRTRAQRYTPVDYVNDLFSLFDEFALVRRCWGPAVTKEAQ